eukprot:4143737-Amphidinium_carterae.1
MQMKVMKVTDLEKNCQIELTTPTLHYLRIAALAMFAVAGEQSCRTREVNGLGVSGKLTWSKNKRSFLACRNEDGKKRYKHFKPEGDDAIDVDTSRNKALSWANFELQDSGINGICEDVEGDHEGSLAYLPGENGGSDGAGDHEDSLADVSGEHSGDSSDKEDFASSAGTSAAEETHNLQHALGGGSSMEHGRIQLNPSDPDILRVFYLEDRRYDKRVRISKCKNKEEALAKAKAIIDEHAAT